MQNQEKGLEVPKGHRLLVKDIFDILNEAMEYEFHDFKNTKYDTPKIELRNRLLAMAQGVVEGKYDN